MTELAQDARFFVSRLIGPRPTFPMDITPEERELMGVHGQYWRQKMAEGKIVVFGPVLDPKGVWGLGVLRVKDEAEATALQNQDPVILAQRGFSYETLPMMTAVVPV
ncbi:MAG TPA: YciI family protein [Polyangiaceae bacterium]|nr:YciI family protein [Polyangiaceae bacterium]